MKDVLELFYSLPIELRSKIVYSGYIIAPTSIIIKNLKKEIKEYNERRWSLDTMNYEEATFYNILKDLNYLKDLDEILEQQILYMFYIYAYQQAEV
tara:strand:- start:11785 stop:12072 length:288 start_codon:yes stop_codon:yes gene_type:complete